jgi:hypothetical protein
MAVACAAGMAGVARADVKVQDKTLVKFEGLLGGVVNLFGGKAAKEGVTSTVAVKGDRRARLGDTTGEIVDLAEEKVYELDLKNKTYKVTTFAEVRKRMEEQEEKARQSAASADEKSSRAEKESGEGGQKQYEVDFNVKDTGQKRAVNGFEAQEKVLTIAIREKGKTLDQSGGLQITSDMWVAPTAAKAREIAAFEQRYMEKLHGPAAVAGAQAQMAMLLGTYPALREGLARMQAEGAKIDGTPVQSTMTIEVVKSPQQMAQAESSNQGGAGLGGMLGRFGKKKNEEAPAGPKNRSTLMTTTYEILNVAPDVSAADVALPAGFRQK